MMVAGRGRGGAGGRMGGGSVAEGERVEYDIRLETRESRPLAVVRRRALPGELSKVVPEACGTVWGVIRGQLVAGAGRHIAVYLDGQINLEVGVELSAPFGGYGEVVGSATPAGLVASTTHYGPYGQLGAAHEAIRLWCQNHGYMPAGPNWEIYGHWRDEWNRDPSQICTEVCYLLAAGKSVSPGAA
jgi:hypothetical protein